MSDQEFRVRKGLIVNNNLLVATNGKVSVNTASPNVSFVIASNDAILIPVGGTGDRPATGANGYVRYNSDTSTFEGYSNSAWGPLITASSLVAPGPNTSVQFNDSGTQSGTSGFIFNKTTNNATLANTLTVGTGTINTTTYTGSSNNSTYFSGQLPAYYANVTSPVFSANISVGNSTVNSTVNSTAITVGVLYSAQINTAANLAFTSANVYMGSAILTTQDLTVTGNVTISGTLATIDATNIQTKDALIKLADQQTTADILSIGFYGEYGNSTVTQYGGLFRDQGNAAVWTLFNSQKEPTTTVDTSNNTYGLGNLLLGSLYLGNSTVNAISNSSFLRFTNSTISANLSLASGLALGIVSVNSIGFAVGTTSTVNSSVVFLGNTTQNCVITSSNITINGASIISISDNIMTRNLFGGL